MQVRLCVAGLALSAIFALPVKAQVGIGGGQLSASVETNSIYYVEDKGLGENSTPDDRFGSNSYLKLDYTYGKFSAGIQAEAYLPALYGYEIGQQPDYKKFYLAAKYVQWQDKNFSVYVGDIYDQFGNGLVFRSFEDRQLGLNNSLEGVKATYAFSRFVSLKGMYGRPRLYTDYAGSWIRGLDLNISIADIFNWEKILLSLSGSYLNRYETLDKDEYVDFTEMGLTTPNLNMYSGRIGFGWNGLDINGEYVVKSKDIPSASSNKAVKGAALYVDAIYNYKKFSISATFRMLENMGTMLSLYGNGTGNTLNYLPALTRQYTYALANLNPYQVNVLGETAGQADVFYSLRSKHNRHKYWNFHANFSTAYTLKPSQGENNKVNMMWCDANVDVERQWNKSLKTVLLYSRQQWSESHGFKPETYVSNIFVADITGKFNRKMSLRGELQYLYSDDYEGDWIAALLEFNMAPRWSFFVSDMYNIDKTEKHYYSAGFSYTKNRTRFQLSYGRNRAGYICSGGVCRYSPEYTGLNFTLTTSI